MGKFLTEKKLVCYLVANRIIILLGAYFWAITSPIQKVLPFKSFSDFMLTFAHRWDGNSYTFIAIHGYVTSGAEKSFIVFPPLYPLFIKFLTLFGINPTLSGVLVSNIFFIGAMIILFKLIELDYHKKIAYLTIILISIFPTTFFFSIAYPESLFVFLFALSFYLARKRKYLFSGLAGGLAVITRPFGIIIFPALILYLFIQKDLNFKKLALLSTTFGLPILVYLLINYSLFGSPFAFLEILKDNWQKSFAFPWDGILASWKRGIFTPELSNYKFFVGYGEAIASTLAWISIPIGIKHWGIKSPYLIYLLLATILFTSTGFILSAPRYILSIPPFFIIFAKIFDSNKILKILWIIVSVALLFYISYEFAWGQWTF
jgi:Gpi18-like mannosyltransferase